MRRLDSFLISHPVWVRNRLWKHVVGLPLLLLALNVLKAFPVLSGWWDAALVGAVLLVVFYVAEEIAWVTRHEERRCANCAKGVPMDVRGACPHCGSGMRDETMRR